MAAVALVALFAYEILIPGIAFIIYLAIRGMTARVINDRDHCRDKPWPSMLWGMIWATAYTAPIAAAVYAVHWWILRNG